MGIGRPRARYALVAVALLSAWASARAQTAPDENKRRSITVVGVGRERGAPDTAQLRFAVEENAQSAKAAAEAAAASAARVMAALEKGVGAGGRVETLGYALNPVYRQPSSPAPATRAPSHGPEIVGYTAAHTIAVETHQLDRVGSLIDAATAAGAARIDSLAFTIENVAPVQARALADAGADAAAQAAALADALHVTLKEVLEAATEGVARPLPQRLGGIAMRAEAMQATTPIAPGEVTTEARLRVTYAIQ